jgi:effector-binding domain-containing protein
MGNVLSIGDFARITHLSVKTLRHYVTEHALAISGPVRETYLVGPRDTLDATSWRTEIGWPIFRTGSGQPE